MTFVDIQKNIEKKLQDISFKQESEMNGSLWLPEMVGNTLPKSRTHEHDLLKSYL